MPMKSTSSTIIRRRSPLCRTLAALFALLLLPAFGGATSVVPTSMHIAMVVSPDMQLYPLTVMDRDALSILDLVYDSVISIDDDNQPQPSLATSWDVLTDGKTWLFTIRENVFFHDGRELTAYDVAATMSAIQTLANTAETPSGRGMYSELVSVVSSWEADNERVLRVRTNRPYYGLLYAMTFPVLQAQSTHEINPPGTGPYRIDYYIPGEALWMTGNENWWGGNPPHVGELICDWYATAEDALRAFESEDVDIVMTRSNTAARYRGTVTNRANSYTYSTRQLECLLINQSVRKLGNDVRMRQAIAHAINVSYIKLNTYQGMVQETETLQHPGSWLYNENATRYPNDVGYDPERARNLLYDLGWMTLNERGYRTRQTDAGTEELSLRLYYYDEAGSALRKETASQIATMLRDVGIRVLITPYDMAGATAKLTSGDFDLCLVAVNFDVTPDPYFLLHSSSGPGTGANYARYRSDDMNKILQALRKAIDETEFQQQWYAVQRQMAEDIPLLPLYWREGLVVTRYAYSSVRNIREFELLKTIELYR